MTAIPLRYLSATITAGESRTPADASSERFTTNQQAVQLGDPIPIVFCRRVSDNGGVLVMPKATEARFFGNTSTTPDELGVAYMLVLSEGEVPPLFLKDCYKGSSRLGIWNQSYNRRAESWLPGRIGALLVAVPEHCGTGGSYEGLTTLSVNKAFTDFEEWRLQAYVFVREGMQVTRLLDSTYGPSNNFADLVIYLMKQSKEIPDDLIDTAQITTAANFLEANGLFFNGQIDKPFNLIDWIQETAAGLLLRLVKREGKFGLQPLVQYASDYTYSDKKVNWLYTFMDKHITPGGVQISFVAAEDRKPIEFEVLWRQQPTDDIGYVRSTLIKMENSSGQLQTLDLSSFCTSEAHAAKVAAYNVAIRKYVSHYATITLKPGDYSSHLIVGDIVRLRLDNFTKEGQQRAHDFLYVIQSIKNPIDGTTVLELMHYPLNEQGQSLLTLAVKNAVSPGTVYTIVRDNTTSDENSGTDTATLTDLGLDFSDMLTSTDWDVYDEADLSTEIVPIAGYQGPHPINDEGETVSVEGDGYDFADVTEVDEDEDFDPEEQATQAESGPPDEINPEEVTAELAPDVSRCGPNTKLNREEEEIDDSNLDSDGNPSEEQTLSPFAYPWERWPNTSQTSKKFDSEIENIKNERRLVTINTSTMLNLTLEQRPFGSNTRVYYYRVEEDGTKTFIDKTSGSYSTKYPATYDAGGGFTYAPADVGRPIEVRLVNISDTTQSVYYTTLPACTASALSYDWLKVLISINQQPNVRFKEAFWTPGYSQIEGIFPQAKKTDVQYNNMGEGRLDWTDGIQAGPMINVIHQSRQYSYDDKTIEVMFNLNSYRIAFPSLKPLVFDLFPIFTRSGFYPDPTGFTLTTTATFYKGTWEGNAITGWPLISSNQVLSQSTSYSVNSVTPEGSPSPYAILGTSAPEKFRLTVNLSNYSVTFA